MDKELKASREKNWDDLNLVEKVERMRLIIKKQEKTIERMGKYLDSLVNHDHLDGKIVQVIPHPNAESYGSIYYNRKREDQYF